MKKGNKKVDELKEAIHQNRIELDKMRKQEEQCLRRTIELQDQAEYLKVQLKEKGLK